MAHVASKASGAPRLDILPTEIIAKIVDELVRAGDAVMHNVWVVCGTCHRLRSINFPRLIGQVRLEDWERFGAFLRYIAAYPQNAPHVRSLDLSVITPPDDSDWILEEPPPKLSLPDTLNLQHVGNIRKLAVATNDVTFFQEHFNTRSLPTFQHLEEVSFSAVTGYYREIDMGSVVAIQELDLSTLYPFWTSPRLRSFSLNWFEIHADQNNALSARKLPQLEELKFVNCDLLEGVVDEFAGSRSTKKLHVQDLYSDFAKLIAAFAQELENLILLGTEYGTVSTPAEKVEVARFSKLRDMTVYIASLLVSGHPREDDLAPDALFVNAYGNVCRIECLPHYFPACLERLHLVKPKISDHSISTFRQMVEDHVTVSPEVRTITLTQPGCAAYQ